MLNSLKRETMKKIALSVASLVAVASLHAGTDGVNTKLKHGADADSVTTNNEISVNHISDMFQQGKVSGQIRMFYIDREYQGGSGSKTHRDTTALGGHLKFETAKLSGFYAGAAFYVEYNGALYSGSFPVSQAAADGSFSTPLNLTAVTSANQSLD